MECRMCNNKIGSARLAVQCIQCNNQYHCKCIDIAIPDIELINCGKKSFKCTRCLSSNDTKVTLEDVMQSLREIINKNSVMCNSIEFCHTRIEENNGLLKAQDERINSCLEKINMLSQQNNELKKENIELKRQLNEQNQYSHRCRGTHKEIDENNEPENFTLTENKITNQLTAFNLKTVTDHITNSHCYQDTKNLQNWVDTVEVGNSVTSENKKINIISNILVNDGLTNQNNNFVPRVEFENKENISPNGSTVCSQSIVPPTISTKSDDYEFDNMSVTDDSEKDPNYQPSSDGDKSYEILQPVPITFSIDDDIENCGISLTKNTVEETTLVEVNFSFIV
ncbi:hypothetical protein RN001_006596 [Aquatica leii]|uniref:Phorbol-ester/DAG-type domain-containing protein n=1 Tax=Aquatica leii TaxID=1421715 RepID=A0AAN7SIP2_9COLE|nr:hypothetical protein RN001_006596 [Aquatica leii]